MCSSDLDPVDRLPGQQPYQGVVPLAIDDEKLESLSKVLQHYMRQSEQLDTTLVLASNETVSAGLLIQRLPVEGAANLQGRTASHGTEADEDYQRIATLAASLSKEELLELDVDAVLHRLFWQEPVLRLVEDSSIRQPHFKCTCSRERVAKMLQALGEEEAGSILAEQGQVGVSCDFCGAPYTFDQVDVAGLFQAGPVAHNPKAPLQ